MKRNKVITHMTFHSAGPVNRYTSPEKGQSIMRTNVGRKLRATIPCIALALPSVALVSTALGLSLATLGCSSDPRAFDDAEPGAREDAALTAWNFVLWNRSSNQYPINVCFIQESIASPTTDWTSDKERVFSVITETWDAYSGIAFSNRGDCPASIQSAWMPIMLAYDSGNPDAFGGDGAPGKGNRLSNTDNPATPEDEYRCDNCQVRFGYGSNYFEFETAAVHEVGHALGLRHERSRPDFPGCQSLISNEFSEQDPDEGGPYLTKDWDVESVMGEWYCYDARVHDSFAYYYLSRGDKVGIGILYPKSLSRGSGSIGSNGFATSSGPVVRSDGELMTDWTASNASTEVFSTTPSWAVRSGGVFTTVGTGFVLSASALAGSGYDAVRFSYTDYWGRANSGLDNVVVSDSAHTALLNTAVNVL